MPRSILQGVVVSNKSSKTVHVRVESYKIHPVYKKYIKTSKKYAVHDETNDCKVGDKIRIIECRPLSKTKSWQVLSSEQTSVKG